MPIEVATTFEISTDGEVSNSAIDRAKERLGRIGSHCREPISHVELRVKDDIAHPDQLHAHAEATLVVKHGPVRAHASAATVSEAIDLMLARLRRRVDRHESKLHRIGSKRRSGVAGPGSWHHGDVEAAPRYPRPVVNSNATIQRRKTFAPAPMTVEEAIFDLDILDHSFYLFEERDSGEVCVISYVDDGYQVAVATDAELEMPQSVTRADGAVMLTNDAAQRLLMTTGDPFVFYRPNTSRPGQVLYRRYDGNFGVIELGDRTPVES